MSTPDDFVIWTRCLYLWLVMRFAPQLAALKRFWFAVYAEAITGRAVCSFEPDPPPLAMPFLGALGAGPLPYASARNRWSPPMDWGG